MWTTKKSKYIFTHWRVKLLKLLLRNTVHGRTLGAFKQQQVPGRFCEDGKTKSRCQFWEAMRAHCQVAARLGREAVSRAKMGSVTRAHRPRLLRLAAGTGWLQVQPKTQAGEVGPGAAEFKADMAVLAWVLPRRCWWPWGWAPWRGFPTFFLTALQLSLLPGPGPRCRHLGTGLGLAGKWRTRLQSQSVPVELWYRWWELCRVKQRLLGTWHPHHECRSGFVLCRSPSLLLSH